MNTSPLPAIPFDVKVIIVSYNNRKFTFIITDPREEEGVVYYRVIIMDNQTLKSQESGTIPAEWEDGWDWGLTDDLNGFYQILTGSVGPDSEVRTEAEATR